MTLATSRLQRRRAFFRRLRLYAYVSAGALALVGLIYLYTGSSLFRVQTFDVRGIDEGEKAALLAQLKSQIAEGPLGWLGPDHYFAWPETLPYSAPLVASVRIDKAFWDGTITITASPRIRFAVWCGAPATEEDCYWVDTSGILFSHAPIAEGQLVQTIFDTATSSLGHIGEPVLAGDSFTYVKKIIATVQELNVAVNTMTVHRDLQEFWLDTAAGARIRTSLRFDPEPTALPAIIRFSKNPGYQNIEYLNLTVENRAFVKNR